MKQADLVKKVKDLGLTTFTSRDLSRLFPQDKYLNTTVGRLLRAGVLRRVIRGRYALSETDFEVEKIATAIYYPSYLSFESALAKYGIVNQGPTILTLATTRHSKRLHLGTIECEYRQLKPELFFGFTLVGGTYLAEPEKAVLDTLYLAVIGKNKIDSHEWDLSAINPQKLKELAKPFGQATAKAALNLL